MFDKYGLDDRGILPYDDEKEEQFIRRGNAILDVSAKLSDAQLMGRAMFYGLYRHDYFTFGSHDEFDHSDILRRESLAYTLEKYGMDLTWVRFLEIFIDDEVQRIFDPPLGFAMRQDWRSNNLSVVIPVIFIREISARVITHELIHAGRADISENYFFNGDYDRGVGMYEERAAHNRFYRSNFWNLFKLHRQIRNIYRARRKLEKYFGDKAGYVFIRLNYQEAMYSLFEARDPVAFIKEQSLDNPSSCRNLKFKIMADKLGL
ncbi:MAG: hypothetical protein AAB378_02755 [Patescibacteria group bacterium]